VVFVAWAPCSFASGVRPALTANSERIADGAGSTLSLTEQKYESADAGYGDDGEQLSFSNVKC